jgi:curved DNA-binding protein
VDLTIPPGIGSGKKLRIPGKGLGGKTRADQLVRILIQVPASLSAEERELWEKLARTSALRAETF